MDRIAAMHSFVRAVDTGSFTAVAREQNTTQPTISKQIAALENKLGVQLLVRTTRSLSVTEDGARYYAAAKAALDAFEAADAVARGTSRSIEGVLRIGCPVSFGQVQIVPRLAGFLARFPLVSVDLVMSDAFLDPVEQGVDVVIRIGDLRDSSLKARKIGLARRVTVASHAYIGKFGRPERLEDLARHDCVLYTRLATGPEWHYRTPEGPAKVRVQGRIKADNSVAMLGAVRAGLGIGFMPLWLAGEDLRNGRLLLLLEDLEPQSSPIHAVSPPRKFQPPKVTAVVEYLTAEFKSDPSVSGAGTL